jgi:PKD repeat protein
MRSFARLGVASSILVALSACTAEKFLESPVPVAAFEVDRDTCYAPCDLLLRNASSGADRYEWSFGDGTVSSEAEPSHVFTRAGTYSVRLTAANEGGADSAEKFIVIVTGPSPLIPIASFQLTADTCMAPCDPGIVNTSVGASTYQWSFGDGAVSTEAMPAHVYQQPGNYTIQLTASSPTGTHAVAKPMMVLPNPALCDSIDCGINGICLNGVCTCAMGYDPDPTGMCTLPWNQKFIGEYAFYETCPSWNKTYVVHILPGPANDQILITNFFNAYVNPLPATIVLDANMSSNKITYNADPDNDGFPVTGDGQRSANGNIGGNFTIVDLSTGQTISCSYVAVKL